MDEKVLDRVRKLLAKAESCSNFGTPEGDNEAEALMAKAQEMIAEHAITEAMLSSTRGDNAKPEMRQLTVPGPFAIDKASLLAVVCKHNRVRVVLVGTAPKAGKALALVGFADDLDTVDMLFTSLLVQMTNEAFSQHFEVQTTPWGRVIPGGSKESQRRNFMLGYIDRVNNRLAEAARVAEETVQQKSSSSVALVLRDRNALVHDEFRQMFPDARERRRTVAGNRAAYRAGQEAGSRADLGQKRVGTRQALPS